MSGAAELPQILLLVLALSWLPAWFQLAVLVPALMLLTQDKVLPVALRLGEVDMAASDILFAVAGIKVLFKVLRRSRFHLHRPYLGLTVYVLCCFLSTILAYAKFGEEVFHGELIALARFCSQAAVLPLLAEAMDTREDLARSLRALDWLGYSVAAILWVNVGLALIGIDFGEVQRGATLTRFFGPFGDQIGFILPFFIFRHLAARKEMTTLFFLGPLAATGTRGTIPVLVLGLIFTAYQSGRFALPRPKNLIALTAALSASFVAVLVADVGGLKSRITGPMLWGDSTLIRFSAWEMALALLREHAFLGMGYMGIRFINLIDYRQEYIGPALSGFNDMTITNAQNQTLQAITDGGFVGLIAFGFMAWTFAKAFLQAPASAPAAAKQVCAAGFVWFCAMLLGNQTAVWLNPSSLISYLLWIVLGLALASKRLHA